MTAQRPILLATLALAALPGALRAQAAAGGDPTRSLAPWRMTAQVASGVALAPVGFVAGGLATRATARALGAGEDRASSLAYGGAWTAAALATAAGPALVGARGPGSGSYPAALGGALVGGGMSWAIVRLNKLAAEEGDPRPCRVVCVVSGLAVGLLPSVGATIGYNLSRSRAD